MNIQEDYVSFETAKLLKEKGFDEECYTCYVIDEIQHYDYKSRNSDLITGIISAPTLQMAMKWLREVHNIFICIIPCEVGAGVMDYTYTLYKIDAKNFHFEDLGIQGRAKNISEISYEKVVDAAIRYCLENLI